MNCNIYNFIHILRTHKIRLWVSKTQHHQGYTSANFSFIQFFNRSLSYSVDGILPRICIYSSGYLRTLNTTRWCTFEIFYLVNVSVIVITEVYSRC